MRRKEGLRKRQVDSLGCRRGDSAQWEQEARIRSEADKEEEFKSGKNQDKVEVRAMGEKLGF